MFLNEFCDGKEAFTYTVVNFTRRYAFGKPIRKATVRCSADVFFSLKCNQTTIARGPACGNGDFMYYDRTKPSYYATECELPTEILGDDLFFEATVRAMPTPYGMITVEQTQGQSPRISAPPEIEVLQ